MTNPYEAPIKESEASGPRRSRIGLVGCGCALAFLGLAFFGFLAMFATVRQSTPVPLPVAPAPAPVAPAPTPAPTVETTPAGELAPTSEPTATAEPNTAAP